MSFRFLFSPRSLGFALVLLLATAAGAAGDAPSKHASQDFPQSILPRPEEQIDLAETALLISKEWAPSLNLEPYRAKLNQLTEKIKKRLSEKMSPETVVSTLRLIIHQEEGYSYTERVDEQGIPLNSAEIFLHGLLDSKKGYCMNLSLLYLVVGERLGLPLRGVALPNHFFVRYESPKGNINIETTQSGASLPDSFYQDQFGVSPGKPSPFFMKSLGKKQTLGSYFSNVGMAYYKHNKAEQAISYLKLSAEINPQSVEARNNLGNIYSELKQYNRAIEQYLLALKADPGDVPTLFNLGIAHSDAGNKQKAIDSFLQAAQIDPFFIPAQRSLAQLYFNDGKFVSALLHFKKLLDLDPQNPQAHVNVASAYLQMGHFNLALETVNRAKSMFPENPDVLGKLAEIYYRSGKLDMAIAQYRHLVEYNPEHLEGYIQLGWTYYKKGDIKMAIVWTQRGLARAKEPRKHVTLAWMNLGFLHLLDKNFPAAESWYSKALSAKDPDSLGGMIKDLEEASGKFPDLAEIDYFAGWLFYESGQREKAEPLLSRYLQRSGEGLLAEKARGLIGRLQDKNAFAPAPGTSFPKPVAGETEQTPGAEGEPPGRMVKIPAGFFVMGSNERGEDERPERKVFLDAYFIDKYEATAGEYAQFLNAAGNSKSYYMDNKFGTLQFDSIFRPLPGLESYPINNVSWFGADAYCRWKNKRLPTEAQWEKAARGPNKQIYPWGDSPALPSLARYRQVWTEEIQHKVMVPVDSMPEGKSSYGVFHMAGNVKEWVDDWYDREYSLEDEAQLNPRGPMGGEFKIMKGGSWRDLPGFIYSSFRNNSYPETRLDDYGFRCAKSEKESSSEPQKLIRMDERTSRNPGANF